MYQIKPVIALDHFRIVTHSYAGTFSIKTCLDKTNNFFNLKTKAICLNHYESKLKKKVASRRTFF